MAETMTASGMAGPRRVRYRVHCWAGEGKKQIVVTRESDRDTPTPGVFSQRVRNRLKIKELSFWQGKRVRKSVKGKNLREVASGWVASSGMGIVGTHPAILIRAANRGLTG